MQHNPTVKLMRISLSFALALSLFFFSYHVWVADYPLAYVEAFMFICFLMALVVLRKEQFLTAVTHFTVGVGLIGALVNMLNEPSTAVWPAVILVCVLFFFDKKEGGYWAMIINVAMIIFMLVDNGREIPVYSKAWAISLIASYLCISLVLYFAYQKQTALHGLMLLEETERERREMAKTLASGVAHLINNEMLGIIGESEIMQFRLKNEVDLAALNRIIDLSLKASDHANWLVFYAQGSMKKKQKMCVFETLSPLLQSWQRALPSTLQLDVL